MRVGGGGFLAGKRFGNVGACSASLSAWIANKVWSAPWRSFSQGSSDEFTRRYDEFIRAGVIKEDKRQRSLLSTLSSIFTKIRREDATGPKGPRTKMKSRRGCYIHGSVGAGKTMLMQMFYESVRGLLPTRRVHFHEFMLSIHSRIHAYKQRGPGAGAIQEVAREIAYESQVLCLDEVQLVDIADVAMLSQVLPVLWQHGVCVIATSNVPPSRLFEGGLNRHVYMPKLERLLDQHCCIFDMSSSGDEDKDHRLDAQPVQGMYQVVRKEQEFDALPVMWTFLSALELQRGVSDAEPDVHGPVSSTTSVSSASSTIPLPYGRSVRARKVGRRIVWLDFASVFNQPTGATDFLTIAERFLSPAAPDVPSSP
eukprot:768495-Hanusia_phi.AAC.5